jgi:hypothetical protein
MKPVKWAVVAATLTLSGLAACGERPVAKSQHDPASDGWTQPPDITSAQLAGATLIIDGRAEPGARVVLRNDGDAAYAASADGTGRFQIRIVAASAPLLLRPETQEGQDAAASPSRLLIIDGGKGPIAVLRPGAPARRLGASPPLAAVDSDGRMALASGVTTGPVTVSADGRTDEATPDAGGRWSVLLETAAARDVRVGQRTFSWPGAGQPAAEGQAQAVRAGQGWLVAWPTGSGTQQSTWLPDG